MPNDQNTPRGLSTLCVHGGESLDANGAMSTPLYNHTTFGFRSTQALLDVVERRVEGSFYTRYGMNPTIRAVEQKLAALEGAEHAWVFGSGMAAISATFLGHCKAGDNVVCIGDVYGGTFELLSNNLPGLGITTTFLLNAEVDRLSDALRPNTKVVFLETPTNPSMEVLDVERIARVTRGCGALTVVDNTFATPVNQRPLRLGADLVVHSATKYLGGHSDLTGGVVMGTKALLDAIWPWRTNLGQIMAPEVAFLLARSLRTLAVRVRAHNAAGAYVAERLARHPRVRRVSYPGLPSFAGHEIARRQMQGFGGMVSFVYDGDAAATARLVDQLELFAIAPSLGGVESLVTQPLTTTHHDMSPAERARRGIEDGMVRLSCGLEDPEDLWADLERALNGARLRSRRADGTSCRRVGGTATASLRQQAEKRLVAIGRKRVIR